MRFISSLGHRRDHELDIVIAGDDRAAVSLLVTELATVELEARSARPGELASREDEPPDLAILDGDGVPERCRALKQLLPELPVIAIVAASARIEALRAGADHCVTRPLDLAELAARARVLVDQGRRYRGMAFKLDTMRLWQDWVRYLVHDLRGPLTTAMTTISFAKSTRDMSRVTPALQALDEMAAMLHDILDSDRIKHGVLVPAVSNVDLAELARAAAAAAETTHPIEITSEGDTTIDADPKLFRRVFANLLANAARYAKTRPIAVEIAGGSHGVSARVRNDGPRVPPEVQAHLFEPWHPVDDGGTGIGLAFCKLVCEAHGGRIWLDSAEAGDVAFAFGLPRVAKAAR